MFQGISIFDELFNDVFHSLGGKSGLGMLDNVGIMKKLRNDKCYKKINGKKMLKEDKIHISCLAPFLPQPWEPSAIADFFFRNLKRYRSNSWVPVLLLRAMATYLAKEFILTHSSRMQSFPVLEPSSRNLRQLAALRLQR